jgi:hypothetical protein
MPEDSNDIKQESNYPELERPNFTPNIPAYLMEGASEQDKYIIQQLSILNQFADWSVNAHLATNKEVRHTNGRVTKMEDRVDNLGEKAQKSEEIYPTGSYIAQAYRILQNKVILGLMVLGISFVLLVLYPLYIKYPLPFWKWIEKTFLE